MAPSSTILVFGVSGVGKTVSCEDYVSRHPEWLYLRASALLAEITGETPESLRTETAGSIKSNQNLLGEALRAARAKQGQRSILLDAHAIIDNDKALVEVPLEAVADLGADAMILLEASAQDLAQRRAQAHRRRPARSIDQLTREIAAESQTVAGYARKLKIPLASAIVGASFSLDPIIDKLAPKLAQPAG
ncbi:AAA family ATPase [Sphingomonas koreensis]|uniref:AAA family ATPase n=1 Tax=Sphingomonas koreensis TaxID=93064 RepID=UPI0013DFB8B7|nr:AAA family ATPase [Sphingomonas koreensis]